MELKNENENPFSNFQIPKFSNYLLTWNFPLSTIFPVGSRSWKI